MIVGVLVPGLGYTTQGPLLSFAGEVLERHGARVEHVSWQFPAGLDRAAQEAFVRENVSAVLDKVPAGAAPLLVAKSIGTLSAPLAAERGIPAIWLTPLVLLDVVADAIRRNPAPTLLVGGTADRLWHGGIVRRLGRPFLEIPDGDHALFVPGPVRRSAEVLGDVATAIDEFVGATAG
jgi:alpha-beta hydrolase superfamily lysophospholipase